MSTVLVHVVMYARNLGVLAAFYEGVLGLGRVEAGASFVLLGGPGIELSIVAIPEAHARGILISNPPLVREDTPIKVSYLVPDVEACRPRIGQLGGALKPREAAWSWRGQLHLDGVDPEGNVYQLRQRLSGTDPAP